MKVAFYSNYLNHHQLPFCMAMDRLTNGQFTFVATMPVSQDRLAMGYHDMDKAYPFVLTAYDCDKKRKAAMKLAMDCDVLIMGSAPEAYMHQRMKSNKLTFRYSERLWKKGILYALRPRKIAMCLLYHTRYFRKSLYMLCASAYTAFDTALFGAYMGKTYKWGYFPETKVQNEDELFSRKQSKERVSILWAGRLIEWKHPDNVLILAERLQTEGYVFDLNIIGNGQMEAELKELIATKNLNACVHMLGAMPPENVREYMEEADIFLFTSDFNEGWGAVLNESMNSACAVVASHAIGSVPFLLEDGKNGFIYRNGDLNQLYERVVHLIEHPELREAMGRNAYQTLAKEWNADVAAERFIALAQALIDGENTDLFQSGPCSKAGILQNGWYRGE